MAKTRKNRLSPEAIAKRIIKIQNSQNHAACQKMAAEASAAQKEFILQHKIKEVKKLIKLQGYDLLADSLKIAAMQMRFTKKHAKKLKLKPTRKQLSQQSCMYLEKHGTYINQGQW